MTDQSRREGYALVLAILGVVLVGALIVATSMAVALEHRMAVVAVARQRAFAATEHALWRSIVEWDGSLSALARGDAVTRVVPSAGDSARITTVRLNENIYWLVSEAAVGGARRRTGVNLLVVADSGGARVIPVSRSWVDLH